MDIAINNKEILLAIYMVVWLQTRRVFMTLYHARYFDSYSFPRYTTRSLSLSVSHKYSNQILNTIMKDFHLGKEKINVEGDSDCDTNRCSLNIRGQ